MRDYTDQKTSVFGHFLRSENNKESTLSSLCILFNKDTFYKNIVYKNHKDQICQISREE